MIFLGAESILFGCCWPQQVRPLCPTRYFPQSTWGQTFRSHIIARTKHRNRPLHTNRPRTWLRPSTEWSEVEPGSHYLLVLIFSTFFCTELPPFGPRRIQTCQKPLFDFPNCTLPPEVYPVDCIWYFLYPLPWWRMRFAGVQDGHFRNSEPF